LVDTRATHEYATGHIPGAIHLDFFNISLADTSRRVFDAFMSMMGYLMASRGVSFDKTIVFYVNIASMRAARGFWFCEYLGLKDVRVLDGGLTAWTNSGYPVTTECIEPRRGSFDTDPQPGRHIGVEELKSVLGQKKYVVLDVRSDDEYHGRVARVARLLGFPDVRNYIGSWKEWGDRMDLPIEAPEDSTVT